MQTACNAISLRVSWFSVMTRTPNAERKTMTKAAQAIDAYEARKAELIAECQKLIAAVEDHDRNASLNPGGHTWGHVGDLQSAIAVVKDRVMTFKGKN